MTRATALARLRSLEVDLRSRGLSALYVFGSVARDQANEASDLDLLFDAAASARLSYFGVSGARLMIADALGCRVDLVERRSIDPFLRATIEGEAVKVF